MFIAIERSAVISRRGIEVGKEHLDLSKLLDKQVIRFLVRSKGQIRIGHFLDLKVVLQEEQGRNHYQVLACFLG